MTNRQELKKLIKAKDARLAPIAPTTVKGHADGTREPSTAFALALYARLGMDLEGWLSRKELAALDKAAPRPMPDSVYDGFDPLEAK